MITGLIVVAVIVILLIAIIGCYNSLVKKKLTVEEAFATMDVYLKKRFDLIPNLVETVKGYAKHESATLEKIVSLRNKSYEGMTMDEKVESGAQLSQAIPKIMALAENYPDLKASDNFRDLSAQLNSVENDIANARKYYNGAVKRYNMAIQTVPSNIIAGLFHFESKRMFEVEDSAQRENVKVEF